MKKEKLNKINVGIDDSTLYAESSKSNVVAGDSTVYAEAVTRNVGADDPVCPLPQRNTLKKQTGITLVALVITIIVMLLLSVVSINLIQNAGLIEKVKLSKEEHRASTIQEQKELFEKEIEISKYDGDTPKTINDLLNKLEEQKLITEEEKSTIMQTGRITIGSKEIVFDTIILPEGYTRCEYLESTGTQYIDTGVPCDSINAMESTVSISLISKQMYPFGADGNGYTRFSISYDLSNGKVIPEFRIGYYYYVSNRFDYNDKITIKLNAYDGTYYLNGNLAGTSPYSLKKGNLILASHTIGVFSKHNINDKWNNNSANGLIKCYAFKLYNGNTIVQDLIPALDANGTPCMYDIVSGQTFYNQGTGEFIPGPISEVLPKLPKGYTRCAYLESTGTQCIDTEFVPKVSAKLEMELKFDGDFQAIEGNTNVFGASDTQTLFTLNFGEAASQKNQLFCWCEHISKDENKIRSLTINDDIRLNRNKIVFQSEKIIYANLSANMATRNSENDDSLAIFGRKRNGVYYPFKAYNMYLYSCKLYNGDELERNLIPCLDINDTPCMYDTVSGQTFYNQGTGEFIAGPVVE